MRLSLAYMYKFRFCLHTLRRYIIQPMIHTTTTNVSHTSTLVVLHICSNSMLDWAYNPHKRMFWNWLVFTWLDSLTVTCWTCNPEVTQGRRFDSAPGHCQVTTLGKLFTHMSPSSIIWYWLHRWDVNRHTTWYTCLLYTSDAADE